MSLVSHDSNVKNIVSFISKITMLTLCWHFTATVFKSLASADRLGFKTHLFKTETKTN